MVCLTLFPTQVYKQSYDVSESQYSLQPWFEAGDLVLDAWGNLCRVVGVAALTIWTPEWVQKAKVNNLMAEVNEVNIYT